MTRRLLTHWPLATDHWPLFTVSARSDHRAGANQASPDHETCCLETPLPVARDTCARQHAVLQASYTSFPFFLSPSYRLATYSSSFVRRRSLPIAGCFRRQCKAPRPFWQNSGSPHRFLHSDLALPGWTRCFTL